MTAEGVISRLKAPVLIVTEDQIIGQHVVSMLSGMGINEVVFASTAEEAYARMTVMTFDLIVADAGAGTFDPLDPIRAMRALGDAHLAETPVILLIETADPVFLTRVKDTRIEFAVTKPIAARIFCDRVQRALHKRLDAHPHMVGEPVVRLAKPRYTILLLTSNRGTCQLVRNVFIGLGRYDLLIADNALDAVRSLAARVVDIVIADTGEVTFDSLQVIDDLRHHANHRLAHLPVVMLAPEGKVIPPAQLGIEFIVAKPMVVGAFCEAIDRAAARSDLLLGCEAPAAGPVLTTVQASIPAPPPPAPVADVGEDTVWVV